MKYLFLLSICGCLTSCAGWRESALAPDHFGISSSCEWEIQDGCKAKHKPKVGASLDWNL